MASSTQSWGAQNHTKPLQTKPNPKNQFQDTIKQTNPHPSQTHPLPFVTMLSCPFARFSKGCQVLPSPFSKGLTPFAKGLTPFRKGLTPFAKGYPFCQGGDPFYQGFCQEADPFCQGVAPLSGWSLLPRDCTVDPFAKGLHS